MCCRNGGPLRWREPTVGEDWARPEGGGTCPGNMIVPDRRPLKNDRFCAESSRRSRVPEDSLPSCRQLNLSSPVSMGVMGVDKALPVPIKYKYGMLDRIYKV
ncbi:MAG: hypothetical protein DRH37_11680 [Deltaproteobacteria bacterium]|nr:MAG: hypothetical protein DRH37_11680 [Deltaproteobacteria bacterium]